MGNLVNTAFGFGGRVEVDMADNSERPLDSYIGIINALAVAESQAVNGPLLIVAEANNPFQDKARFQFVRSTGSTGSVNLVGALANDTVTVNGLVYTAVAGVKANNTQFSIDGDNATDALDLADSINNDTRTGTLGDVAAVGNDGTVNIFQFVTEGAPGDATTLVSSNGTRLPVSGATFSGGGDNIVFFGRDLPPVESFVDSGTYEPAALSTGRAINIELQRTGGNTFNLRSLLASTSFIQERESAYEQQGGDAAADTATNFAAADVLVRGATPFETFTWNMEKTGNQYVIIPTTTS